MIEKVYFDLIVQVDDILVVITTVKDTLDLKDCPGNEELGSARCHGS